MDLRDTKLVKKKKRKTPMLGLGFGLFWHTKKRNGRPQKYTGMLYYVIL